MEEILEKLDDVEDIDDVKKIVKEVLNRDLTDEELLAIENEEDNAIENLIKEIVQEIEKNVPEEEKEDFYANLDTDLLEYIKDDNEKLKRIPNIKGFEKKWIIASLTNIQDRIKAVNLIQDDFEKINIIQYLGNDFLKEYIKSPDRTIKDFDLEEMINQSGDREIIKEYMKSNPKADKVYLIRSVNDNEFIKECLADEELEFSKGQRIDLIKEIKDVELAKEAIYDEGLGLTNNEKIGLLENISDIGLISEYIHDENCSLREEEVCVLIERTEDKKFIRDCILDSTLEINKNTRINMIQSINEDVEIVQEILNSSELELDEKEKTDIIFNTKNVPFIEKFLQTEGENLEFANRYKLLHSVVSDSAFIEKVVKEGNIVEGNHNKLSLVLETNDQELIKRCIHDTDFGWNQSQIKDLIINVEDEQFIERCFQDKQLNLQSEDIYSIINQKNYSEDFIKRCILNSKMGLDNYVRYSLIQERVKDDEFIVAIIEGKYESIKLDPGQAECLLDKNISEKYTIENMEHILGILEQNGISYKDFRKYSDHVNAIYENIDKFLEREGIEKQNIPLYRETIAKMFSKNQEVVKNIDFRILNSKYITTLGEDKINQISCYPDIQEQILGMDDKTYTIFCECLNNIAEKNERWTGFANDIIENLSSGEYEELIQNCDFRNINIENLSSILQSKNVFNVTTTEEVNNIDNIRREICDKIMSGQSQEITGEILKNYSEVDKKRFAILEKIFGQDIDKTQAIISAYGENIEELADKEENTEIIDYVRTLKLIMQEENEEILSNMYEKADIVRNVNTELMETKLKSAYCKELNEGLFKITEETPKVGENIYEAGTDFDMIITSVAAYYHNEPENYERDWNKSLISTQHFCTSYIRNDMMGTAKIPHLCYGFVDMQPDSLMLAGSADLSSGDNKMKASTISPELEKYYTPDMLVNKTERHNELDFARYQNGQKKQPDYIVVFRKNGEIENWDKALKAQEEWKDLPIVIVDQDKCLENERNKVQDLLAQFHETSDAKVLEEAIQKIRNNRQTDEAFCKDTNIEELKKQLEELQKKQEIGVPEKKNEQVTLEDLEENYEMVDAIDRKTEASKISQIYTKLKQVQREGAGYEL